MARPFLYRHRGTLSNPEEGDGDWAVWYGFCEECLCIHRRWTALYHGIPGSTTRIPVAARDWQNFAYTMCDYAEPATGEPGRWVQPPHCKGRVRRLGNADYWDVLEAAFRLDGWEAVMPIVQLNPPAELVAQWL
jgi:hypothetical protein